MSVEQREGRRWLLWTAAVLVALVAAIALGVWLNARATEERRVDQLTCALSGRTDCP
jgi:hypothetical protein